MHTVAYCSCMFCFGVFFRKLALLPLWNVCSDQGNHLKMHSHRAIRTMARHNYSSKSGLFDSCEQSVPCIHLTFGSLCSGTAVRDEFRQCCPPSLLFYLQKSIVKWRVTALLSLLIETVPEQNPSSCWKGHSRTGDVSECHMKVSDLLINVQLKYLLVCKYWRFIIT